MITFGFTCLWFYWVPTGFNHNSNSLFIYYVLLLLCLLKATMCSPLVLPNLVMVHSTSHMTSSLLCSSFSGEPSPGSSIRYVETQSMQIGASYSLQFSLVMGCGREPSPHIDTQVRLEFSTNHGLTWHLVKEVRARRVKCTHLCSLLIKWLLTSELFCFIIVTHTFVYD